MLGMNLVVPLEDARANQSVGFFSYINVVITRNKLLLQELSCYRFFPSLITVLCGILLQHLTPLLLFPAIINQFMKIMTKNKQLNRIDS